MSISWLTENSNTKQLTAPSWTMLKKSNNSKSDSDGNPVNIICGNEEVARKLLSAIDKLNFDFPTLNLRFGWIKNERKDVKYRLPLGDNLLVGQDKHIAKHLKGPNVKLLHISSHCRGETTHLAYQRHFTKEVGLDSISLGEMREDLSDAETLVRSAESIHFHIDAIRYEDSRSEHSPVAGLDIYRSCKLMRLAGLSRRLKLLAINTEGAVSDRTADFVSTMLWYYLEGQINKEIETMKQKENDIFLVSSNLFEEPIKFVVGHTTGRWWYQHPSTKEYLPCSDKDYKAISMGNLPEAIVSLAN